LGVSLGPPGSWNAVGKLGGISVIVPKQTKNGENYAFSFFFFLFFPLVFLSFLFFYSGPHGTWVSEFLGPSLLPSWIAFTVHIEHYMGMVWMGIFKNNPREGIPLCSPKPLLYAGWMAFEKMCYWM